MRKQALKWADGVLQSAINETRSLIGAAIDLRRREPHRFALFHQRMQVLIRRAGKRTGLKWHAWWERHYAAKAWALDFALADTCNLCRD